MSQTIDQQLFTKTLFELLGETFESPLGIYLDKKTSLFETLATVSAEQASIPVGGKCATLAAQVTHVIFYLDVLKPYILKQPTPQVDWGEIWRTVGAVTPQEWDQLRARLQEKYQEVIAMLQAIESWDDEAPVSGALGIVVHSAYHLGEIRQALCTLQ